MRLRLHPLLCLALFTVLLPLASAAPKPNVLFLLSDDHSYPFLSCYGDTNVKTPTLDKLAAEGMKFHRFFTTAPQCALEGLADDGALPGGGSDYAILFSAAQG